MRNDQSHSDYVAFWMNQAAEGLSAEQLLQLFEQAMDALWKRAYVILGDVTLSAIMDRVLYLASEKFSPFESLKVEPTGIDFQPLRQQANVFDGREFAKSIQFVIVEFLAVIGNLTGEILTPALRSELSRIMPNDSAVGRHEKGKL